MDDCGTDFGLDLKPCFLEVHLLDRFQGECPIPGKDVCHIHTMSPLKQCVHDPVPPKVQACQSATFVLVKPVADDMIGPAAYKRFDHGIRVLRRVGTVPVKHQDIGRGDLFKCFDHGRTFSFSLLRHNGCTESFCNLRRSVCTVAVHNEYMVVSLFLQFLDNRSNGGFFVECRD